MDQNRIKDVRSAQLVVPGTICGDIIGSVYERCSTKKLDFLLLTPFSKYTDDTVCTIGIADAFVKEVAFENSVMHWCRKYPHSGYGPGFKKWLNSTTPHPYNSYGNGSAMRVSAIGAYANNLDECFILAKYSAEFTHNHPEGIKGAQTVASAIFLALHGYEKTEIKNFIESQFGYDLGRRYDDIQPTHRFDMSCQKSVAESIIAFLESTDYESAIRRAVAYGGDADTMAAIAGGIAAAYYGQIPAHIVEECRKRIPHEMRMVVSRFNFLLENRIGQ